MQTARGMVAIFPLHSTPRGIVIGPAPRPVGTGGLVRLAQHHRPPCVAPRAAAAAFGPRSKNTLLAKRAGSMTASSVLARFLRRTASCLALSCAVLAKIGAVARPAHLTP